MTSASRDAAGAEVKIGQAVVQLRGVGIGIERQLVLLDGVGHVLRLALGDGFFFVDAGQRQVIVGLGAVAEPVSSLGAAWS